MVTTHRLDEAGEIHFLGSMRLKSEFWVQAYIRRCRANGVAAMLVRRGQADAGAIYVQVNRRDGTCDLYGPAPSGFADADTDRRWMLCFADRRPSEAEASAYLASEASFDPDFWVTEIEDPEGDPALDDRVVEN